jgi:hypothetical protein
VNFYRYIHSKLEAIGFESNDNIDPCLFISDKVICLQYVDDTIFFSPKKENIDSVINQLREAGVSVEEEDDAAGFFGVQIEHNPKDGTIN